MAAFGQSAVNNWPGAIERLALSTWPGIETRSFQGWVLRFATGKGHRPNSVATLNFTGTDLDAAIAEVEAAYGAKGLKPMFHITPVTAPADLPERLAARGYRSEASSIVYVGRAEDVARACPAGDVRRDVTEEFAKLVRLGSSSPEDGDERLAVVSRLTIPNIGVVALHDGIGRACGHGGAAWGMVAINLVRTDPAYRRLGLARQVMGELARWALEQRCETLSLCVDETNTPARTLYEQIGFKPVYGYHYCVKD